MTNLAKRVLDSHQRVIDSMQHEPIWKQDLALWLFFNEIRRYDEATVKYIQEFRADLYCSQLQEVWNDFYEWEANSIRRF